MLRTSISDPQSDDGKGEDSHENVDTQKERHPCLRHDDCELARDRLALKSNGIDPKLGIDSLV